MTAAAKAMIAGREHRIGLISDTHGLLRPEALDDIDARAQELRRYL